MSVSKPVMFPEKAKQRAGSRQLALLQEQLLWHYATGSRPGRKTVQKRLTALKLDSLAEGRVKLRCAALELQPAGGTKGPRHAQRAELFQAVCRKYAAGSKRIYSFADPLNSCCMYFWIICGPGKQALLAVTFILRLQQFLETELQLPAVSGIGGVVKGSRQFADGYVSCLLALNRAYAGSVLPMVPEPLPAVYEQRITEDPAEQPEHSDEADALMLLAGRLGAEACNRETQPDYLAVAMQHLLLLYKLAALYESGGSALQRHIWSCRPILQAGTARAEIRAVLDELDHLVLNEIRLVHNEGERRLAEVARRCLEHGCCGFEMTLSSLAALYNLEKDELARPFKRHAGVSVTQYITGLRMAAAEQLLRENVLKPGDIARIVGCSGTGRFEDIFKRYSGSSPAAFRARMAGKACPDWAAEDFTLQQ